MYIGVGKDTAGGTVDETCGGGIAVSVAGESLKDVISERKVVWDEDIRKFRPKYDVLTRFLI